MRARRQQLPLQGLVTQLLLPLVTVVIDHKVGLRCFAVLTDAATVPGCLGCPEHADTLAHEPLARRRVCGGSSRAGMTDKACVLDDGDKKGGSGTILLFLFSVTGTRREVLFPIISSCGRFMRASFSSSLRGLEDLSSLLVVS